MFTAIKNKIVSIEPTILTGDERRRRSALTPSIDVDELIAELEKLVSAWDQRQKHIRLKRTASLRHIECNQSAANLNLSFSTASLAAILRFPCGSLRGIPESSTQRFPAATPHVGQGTEEICLAVRGFFIRT